MHAFKTVIVTAFVAAAALGAMPSFAQAQAPAKPAQAARPAKIAGQPNFNGIWQAIGTAHWNLEAHSAQAIKSGWQFGSLAAIPAGQSVIDGDGKIPYLPEALAKRDENRAGWPASDPEVKCYLPGIPRATYLPYPFQIIQGGGNILFAYEYDSANRVVYMSNHQEAADRYLDGLVERSLGRRHSRGRDHRQSTTRPGSIARATITAMRSRSRNASRSKVRI